VAPGRNAEDDEVFDGGGRRYFYSGMDSIGFVHERKKKNSEVRSQKSEDRSTKQQVFFF
jgi:hypothetical protein